METVILLKTDDITNATPLGGNVDIDRLVPAIKTAQDTNIRAIIGDALYQKIQSEFESGTLTGNYAILYNNYLKGMIIHLSTAYYLTYGAYVFGNKGAYKPSSENSTGLSKEEVDYVVKSQEKRYKDYKKQFYRWIKTVSIPEYVHNITVKNNKKIGGWILSKGKTSDDHSATQTEESCLWTVIDW